MEATVCLIFIEFVWKVWGTCEPAVSYIMMKAISPLIVHAALCAFVVSLLMYSTTAVKAMKRIYEYGMSSKQKIVKNTQATKTHQKLQKTNHRARSKSKPRTHRTRTQKLSSQSPQRSKTSQSSKTPQPCSWEVWNFCWNFKFMWEIKNKFQFMKRFFYFLWIFLECSTVLSIFIILPWVITDL